jgi:hypothetical protein
MAATGKSTSFANSSEVAETNKLLVGSLSRKKRLHFLVREKKKVVLQLCIFIFGVL